MKNIAAFILENKKPLLVLGIYLCVSAIITLLYPQWQRPSSARVIAWDTFGYYLYLPSAFIYHDLFHLGFVPELMNKYYLSSEFYQAHVLPNGNYVMSYPIGLALLYSPFFFLGHLAAILFGYPIDGFSKPYLNSVFAGGIFYAVIGIVFTIRNLRFFFSEKITALLLLVLVFGTNYFYYTVFENAMPHNYSFTIIAIIIYLTIRWHNKPERWSAFLIGLLIGLATIIRPSEILVSLIPLLSGVYSRQSVKEKLQLIRNNYLQLLLLIIGAACIPVVQLYYWKIATGNFLYYSYGNLGFDFLHPNILRGLFSFRKGWFVFTPVMVLAFPGILMLWYKKRSLFLTVSVFISAVIYITFSWQVWWYGGSFGQRPMIPSYALLLVPMGFFIQTVFASRILKWLVLPFIGFCLFLNCFQTWQYLHDFWSNEGPSGFAYKLTFLKTHVNRNDIRKFMGLEQLNGIVTDSALVFKTDFNSEKDGQICLGKLPPHLQSGISNSDKRNKILFDSVFSSLKFNYLRIDAKAMFDFREYKEARFSRINVEIKNDAGKMVDEKMMWIQPLIGNDTMDYSDRAIGVPWVWDNVYMYVKLPQAEQLSVKIEAQNPGGNLTYMDDFRLSLLKTQTP